MIETNLYVNLLFHKSQYEKMYWFRSESLTQLRNVLLHKQIGMEYVYGAALNMSLL